MTVTGLVQQWWHSGALLLFGNELEIRASECKQCESNSNKVRTSGHSADPCT